MRVESGSGSARSLVVAGIDPGTRRAGYCALQVSGQDLKVLRMTSFPVRGATIAERLDCLGAKLAEHLEQYEPLVMVGVENGYVGRNPRTSLVTGLARGVAVFVASSTTQAEVELVDPSEARSACGVARFGIQRKAVKQEVLLAITRLLRPKKAPDEDAADAAACAVWAASRVWRLNVATVN